MRRFSRHMLPSPEPSTTVAGWIFLSVAVPAAIGLFWLRPYLLIVVAAIVLFGTVLSIVDGRRWRRIAAERTGESICTFARSFNCRAVDPWIIRAVYEELQPYVNTPERRVPIRATDRLDEDLKIDWEDFEDLAADVAHRAQRSLTGYDRNPFFWRLYTVRDFVAFLNHQPKLSDA